MYEDVKCNSLNEWITNNTSTRTIVLPEHHKSTSRRPWSPKCRMWVSNLDGEDSRLEEEDKKKQVKTCVFGWKMKKQGRGFQNEANPFTKG